MFAFEFFIFTSFLLFDYIYLCLSIFDFMLFWTELQKVLKKAIKLIHGFQPNDMMDAEFISKVMKLFAESKLHGPRYTGASKDDSEDFRGIQSAFQKCLELEMLPSKALHTVEYSILEFQAV